MVSNPAEAPEFPHFSLLPTELRLKIWHHFHSATEPQHLNFRLCPADSAQIPHKRKPCFANPHVLVLKQKCIPTILQISRESREVGIDCHTVGFDFSQIGEGEDQKKCGHHIISKERPQWRDIYWDPEKDIIHLELGWAPSNTSIHTWGSTNTPIPTLSPLFNLRGIKRLALDRRTFRYLSIEGIHVSDLKEIFLVGEWAEVIRYGLGEELGGERIRISKGNRTIWEYKVRRWCENVGLRRDGVRVRLVSGWREILQEIGGMT